MRLGGRLAVLLLGLLVADVVAASSVRDQGGSEPHPVLDLELVWVDAGRTGVGAVEGASRELRALLGESSVRLTSTIASPAEMRFVGGAWVRVVLLSGAPKGVSGPGPVMGFTRDPADGPLTIWIVPAAVAANVGLHLDGAASWNLVARRRFDRAVACVVAHELAHCLGHAGHSRGLMAPRLARRELLHAPLALSSGVRRHLLAGLGRLAGSAEVAGPSGEPAPRPTMASR
jgi:hypothetical protein